MLPNDGTEQRFDNPFNSVQLRLTCHLPTDGSGSRFRELREELGGKYTVRWNGERGVREGEQREVGRRLHGFIRRVGVQTFGAPDHL